MQSADKYSREKQLEAFDRILTIMDELRAKCPWDRKQTFETLRHLTIEETFELADAIIENDIDGIKKEVGDLMLHLVFYAKIGSEMGRFDIADIINTECEKLIFRHPHIYGDTEANDEETVKQNWEKLKLKERGDNSVLAGVPKSLPALIKAMRIQEKARGIGFDWEKKDQVWEKVEEELEEFKNEISQFEDKSKPSEKTEAEFGDLLFSLINYARFVGINPEEALEKTNKKFIHRFSYLEKESLKDGKELSTMTLEEMDHYWEKSKLQSES